jgi:Kelch motif protein
MKPIATLSALGGAAAFWLALTSALVAGAARSQSTGSPGAWSTKAPLLTPRFDVGVALQDGKIYVLAGGAPGKTATQLNQEYDPATDRWRDRAPIPQGATHAGVAGYNGKIYVIGGFTASVHAQPVDRVFEYDIAADTWRQLPPISSPRGSVGVAIVNGKVHAIGGRGLNNVTVATHEVYDPATGKWSQAAPLPTARDHIGVIVLTGRIHVIGGRISTHITDNSKPTQGARGLPYDLVTNGPNTPLHDVYDPATNSWQSAAPLPAARSNGAAVYYHDLILYAGGECKRPDPKGGGDTFGQNEAYDPKTNRWLTLAPLPAGRQGFGAAVVGQYAYFAGGSLGCGGGPITDQLLVFSLP